MRSISACLAFATLALPAAAFVPALSRTTAASVSTLRMSSEDPSAGEPGAKPLDLPWPGLSKDMETKPDYGEDSYKGHDRLKGKRALITGGDSGIGRAVALAFSREGADICFTYLEEEQPDADETIRIVKDAGRKVVPVAGDLRTEEHCNKVMDTCIKELGGIDILINNAGFQCPQDSIVDISSEQFEQTLKTNLYAPFWLTRAAVPHMKAGATIINTCSVFSFVPPPMLLDYAATKAAMAQITKVLGMQLIGKGIRVNGIAPGPILTPMNPATMPNENIKKLGEESPIQRPGQPKEVAAGFVFLASPEASYINSEVIAITGGMTIE